jgi:hypothetical protein
VKIFGFARLPTNVPIEVWLHIVAPVLPGGVTPTATIGPVPTADPVPTVVVVGAVAPSRKNPPLDADTPYEPEITPLLPQILLCASIVGNWIATTNNAAAVIEKAFLKSM